MGNLEKIEWLDIKKAAEIAMRTENAIRCAEQKKKIKFERSLDGRVRVHISEVMKLIKK